MSVTKTYQIAKQEDGWVVASTPTLDRDKDRVLPLGLELENYMKNPVIIWGHSYREPYAIIGRAADMQLTTDAFKIKPEFREPASDSDPMHIIKALWDSDLVRAFSIGFNPKEWEDNEEGGRDYTKAEILEVSLVPIPANQEALRLAVKAFGEDAANAVLKPLPNEHACRLRNPDDFQDGSFRRVSREHEGKKYSVIMGRLQGEDALTEQAYRYSKDTWGAGEARSHCKDHDGQSFELAEGESSAESESEKDDNPQLPGGDEPPELVSESEPTEQPEIEQPEETPAPEELDAPDEVPEELLDILADFVTEIEDHLRSD